MSANARILEGEEREREWKKLVFRPPGYGRYANSTRRVIPLVALHPAT